MLELYDQTVRNKSGGEMLEYWKQTPMPTENFVVERMGQEVLKVLSKLRVQNRKLSESRSQKKPQMNAVNNDSMEQIIKFRRTGEIHQWMYDRYSLKKLLGISGFQNIRHRKADESMIPDFNTYLLDIETDGSVRKPDSLFMEAVKPPRSSN